MRHFENARLTRKWRSTDGNLTGCRPTLAAQGKGAALCRVQQPTINHWETARTNSLQSRLAWPRTDTLTVRTVPGMAARFDAITSLEPGKEQPSRLTVFYVVALTPSCYAFITSTPSIADTVIPYATGLISTTHYKWMTTALIMPHLLVRFLSFVVISPNFVFATAAENA